MVIRKLRIGGMKQNPNLAESHFKAFVPFLLDNFPEGRKDFVKMEELISSLHQISFDENLVIGLIDHKRHQTIYLSENFERITGINRKTFLKWKSMYMFKILKPVHFSYPYRAIVEGLKFFKDTPVPERPLVKRFVAGLKLYDGEGRIRQVFSKTKVLTLDNRQELDISIYYVQDISHLVKGDIYWIRHLALSRTTCFVKQKGKQHFEDILSEREKQITRLLAEHHTSSEIAKKLSLSINTVERHRKNMLKRTGAVNTTALVHLCKLAEVI